MKIGALDISGRDIASLCRRWQIVDLAVFGSVLRDDFGSQSDVDLLVTFAPDAPWTLLDLVTKGSRRGIESVLVHQYSALSPNHQLRLTETFVLV